MRIETLTKNCTVIHPNDDLAVLYSYSTPVAAWISGRGMVRSEVHHSMTTSKHIGRYARQEGYDPKTIERVPQAELNNLIK